MRSKINSGRDSVPSSGGTACKPNTHEGFRLKALELQDSQARCRLESRSPLQTLGLRFKPELAIRGRMPPDSNGPKPLLWDQSRFFVDQWLSARDLFRFEVLFL